MFNQSRSLTFGRNVHPTRESSWFEDMVDYFYGVDLDFSCGSRETAKAFCKNGHEEEEKVAAPDSRCSLVLLLDKAQTVLN
jgi:hypothetical protein